MPVDINRLKNIKKLYKTIIKLYKLNLNNHYIISLKGKSNSYYKNIKILLYLSPMLLNTLLTVPNITIKNLKRYFNLNNTNWHLYKFRRLYKSIIIIQLITYNKDKHMKH